jgi:hypothetical protein
MVEEAAPAAPADSQDQVAVRQAALQRDRLPRDPTAQLLPRPAIRVPTLPMRARAETRIARRPHTTKEEAHMERHPEIAGQPMPEGAPRGQMPRV